MAHIDAVQPVTYLVAISLADLLVIIQEVIVVNVFLSETYLPVDFPYPVLQEDFLDQPTETILIVLPKETSLMIPQLPKSQEDSLEA
jgi:hypothetical protein